MTLLPPNEPTVSIRMLWPFARLIGDRYFTEPEHMGMVGISLEQFGDPDTRLSHRVVVRALHASMEFIGDPTIGLQAGKLMDHGEFDVLEFAARSSANIGECLRMMSRYLRVMFEPGDFTLLAEGEHALWRMQPIDGTPFPAPMNDYMVVSALEFSRRNAAHYSPPIEVRVMHPEPSYSAEYERFVGAKVVFGAPHNGLLLSKSRLDVPMLRANPHVAAAFELQARRALEKLRTREGISGRVREALALDLSNGAPSMNAAARRLGMSAATLRRKLEEEATTFSDLVDEVRRSLAERHLGAADPTISEVAFLLGFSDVRAFARAFRRWTGNSPTEYRLARR